LFGIHDRVDSCDVHIQNYLRTEDRQGRGGGRVRRHSREEEGERREDDHGKETKTQNDDRDGGGDG
jgi:hypothetical protein